MPAYLILRIPRTGQSDPDIQEIDILLRAFAEEGHLSPQWLQEQREKLIQQLTRWRQERLNTDQWIIEELDLQDDTWKSSNILFILPSYTDDDIEQETCMIMEDREEARKLRKECLVTVGATAPFERLIQAAMSPEVLDKLNQEGFTTVTYQYGDSFQVFHDVFPEYPRQAPEDNLTHGILVRAFGFKKEGLREEIRKCQKKEGESEEGLVISHAGVFFPSDLSILGR